MEWSDLLRLAMVGYLLYKVSFIRDDDYKIYEHIDKRFDDIEKKIDELNDYIKDVEGSKERNVDYTAEKLEGIENELKKEKERE